MGARQERTTSWDDQLRAAGRLIREARRRKGWTQVQAASEIDAVLEDETVTQSTVSNWETGRSAPSPSKIRAIEAVFGISDGKLAAALYVPVVGEAAGSAAAPGGPGFEEAIQRRLDDLAAAVQELADEVRRRRPDGPRARASGR